MKLAKAACEVESAQKKMRLTNTFQKMGQPMNNNFKCLGLWPQVLERHVEACSRGWRRVEGSTR